jgi:hypothetical protein|tara:strand:+ start:373 stop:627 length:255 start_codon:yes stop_codon:yes gene_type:complete
MAAGNVATGTHGGKQMMLVKFAKSSISAAEINSAVQQCAYEGNTIVATKTATNDVQCIIEGAGITAGSDYGATGVTSSLEMTFG